MSTVLVSVVAVSVVAAVLSAVVSAVASAVVSAVVSAVGVVAGLVESVVGAVASPPIGAAPRAVTLELVLPHAARSTRPVTITVVKREFIAPTIR